MGEFLAPKVCKLPDQPNQSHDLYMLLLPFFSPEYWAQLCSESLHDLYAPSICISRKSYRWISNHSIWVPHSNDLGLDHANK